MGPTAAVEGMPTPGMEAGVREAQIQLFQMLSEFAGGCRSPQPGVSNCGVIVGIMLRKLSETLHWYQRRM
jgi:hypothetical protein